MKLYAVLFLFFGVYLSVCIWIFLIVTDSVRKITLHGFFRRNRTFIEAVDAQFTKLVVNEPVTPEEITSLCLQMKNKRMRRYYRKRFISFADRIEDKNSIREYFKIALPYIMRIKESDKNMHYSEKSYRLMLMGEFRQSTEKITDVLLNSLDDESFDVRTNALRALSLIGNVYSFNEGLMIACKGEKYFNTRHITEMLGSFEGDKEKLRQRMMECFYDNPETYQSQVLAFLSDNSFCSSMDFILEYLPHHMENKDHVIACLRFFAACQFDERAEARIITILQNEDVELRAIAVKLAPKYFWKDQVIIEHLLGKGYLGSRDWYVRKNSAAALVQIGLEKEELLAMLAIEDIYAKEALIYAMFDAGIMSYDEFAELGGVVSA